MMRKQHDLLIETNRHILTPMTFAFVSKLIKNDITAYDEFGIAPADEWPNEDTREIMPVLCEKLSRLPAPDGFGAWLFIDKADNLILGDGGFKGQPDDNGVIDLGYGIIESKRRQGYALEAAQALIQWGMSQSNVKSITADCSKTNNASQGLLKKLGMREVKQDDEMLYYRLDK